MTERLPILRTEDLRTYFPVRKGVLRRVKGYVKAVDGVNIDIGAQETLGIVGESGCGKTTLLRTVIRSEDPTDGRILFDPDGTGEGVDFASLDNKGLRSYRRQMQLIFQDPFSSLNPRIPIWEIIGEPLLVNRISAGDELKERVAELMSQVGLDVDYMNRYPHAFSGGQRQRIGIARALALEPKLILADEPTSALDVSVQAQILNLLLRLQEERGLSYMFVTHDLSVVQHVADYVAVMYAGRVVETGTTQDIFEQPQHPYTEALLSAVPVPDPERKARRIILSGDVPNPADIPAGCPFHPRCRFAQDICRQEVPLLRPVGSGNNQRAACHFSETLTLESKFSERNSQHVTG